MAIGMTLKRPEGEYDLGASKFFGNPTIPGAWLEELDEELMFFAQIRLADIAELDRENRLPHTGYLYFFVDADAHMGADARAVVRYSPKDPDVLDREHVKFHFLLVRQEAEGQHIYYFNLQSGEWTGEAVAPADRSELLGLVLEILDQKQAQYSYYISARCPLCNRVFKLGLTEEEREGYKRYCDDDEDLEEAIPALNAFEREFLISGMCPDCQCEVFRKELPEDVSRWELE